MARTLPFQGGEAGSKPVRATSLEVVMYVYVVYRDWGPYEGYGSPEGVFLTSDKAKEFIMNEEDDELYIRYPEISRDGSTYISYKKNDIGWIIERFEAA